VATGKPLGMAVAAILGGFDGELVVGRLAVDEDLLDRIGVRICR
jgi:hypothetical protein